MGIKFVHNSRTNPAMYSLTQVGGVGELLAQCHALIDAMVAVDDKECRSTLGNLLKASMPTENQVLYQ